MNHMRMLQEGIALLIRITMLPVILRELVQKNKVTIIVYHRITASLFENHIKYLKKHYSIISLEDFVRSKYLNTLGKLPRKSLVITFDDGARVNYELKFVLLKYNIKITIFACSDIIGTNRHFWFSYRQQVKEDLKSINDPDRLKLLAGIGFVENKDYENPEALAMSEILDLVKAGANIQSHSLTHPILPMCDNTKAEIEIAKSKIDLEQKLGTKIVCFSYPNGDYLYRDIEFCKKAGYLAAVTMEPGFNDCNTDVFKLKRISIRDNASLNQLAVRASGAWDAVKHYFASRRRVKNEKSSRKIEPVPVSRRS